MADYIKELAKDLVADVRAYYEPSEPSVGSLNIKESKERYKAWMIRGFLDYLNTTNEADLLGLKQCGPERVDQIVGIRKQGKKFTRIEDLMEMDKGITKATVMTMIRENVNDILKYD